MSSARTVLHAARRDQSGLRVPTRQSQVKFHVVVRVPGADGRTDARAACDERILLAEGPLRVPAAKVKLVLRCMKAGCRMRWPTIIE